MARTIIRSDSDPVNRGFAVTPSDSVDLPFPNAKLYVGVTGDVKVTLMPSNYKVGVPPATVTGDTVTFTAVPVGFMPVLVQRVWSTGTTALNILGIWNDH